MWSTEVSYYNCSTLLTHTSIRARQLLHDLLTNHNYDILFYWNEYMFLFFYFEFRLSASIFVVPITLHWVTCFSSSLPCRDAISLPPFFLLEILVVLCQFLKAYLYNIYVLYYMFCHSRLFYLLDAVMVKNFFASLLFPIPILWSKNVIIFIIWQLIQLYV